MLGRFINKMFIFCYSISKEIETPKNSFHAKSVSAKRGFFCDGLDRIMFIIFPCSTSQMWMMLHTICILADQAPTSHAFFRKFQRYNCTNIYQHTHTFEINTFSWDHLKTSSLRFVKNCNQILLSNIIVIRDDENSIWAGNRY